MAIATGGQQPSSSRPAWLTLGETDHVGPAAEPRDWLLPEAPEYFRAIYTRVGADIAETLGITSAVAGEGKTTICLGLAVTIAEDYPERRIVVVETDAARPVLAQDFIVEPTPGLVDCLIGNLPIDYALRPTSLDNLHIVPGGGPVRNPGRWLRSERMAMAIGTLRQRYEVVILDLPALFRNSDTLPLTDLADGIIVVARAGVTPAAVVNRALAQLDEPHGKVRGVVMNGVRSAMPNWLRRLCGA